MSQYELHLFPNLRYPCGYCLFLFLCTSIFLLSPRREHYCSFTLELFRSHALRSPASYAKGKLFGAKSLKAGMLSFSSEVIPTSLSKLAADSEVFSCRVYSYVPRMFCIVVVCTGCSVLLLYVKNVLYCYRTPFGVPPTDDWRTFRLIHYLARGRSRPTESARAERRAVVQRQD